MMIIYAKSALLPAGWVNDVAVDIGSDGRIKSVETGSSVQADHQTGVLLPAPVNAHSHAFQRAMAGLTEKRGPNPTDTFWTWRDLMFRFLDQLTPEHIEAITAFVQMEMLEAGYATNVEFHYIHHQPGGTPYDSLSELAQRVIAASEQSGIGLTLLPVAYQFGGCDQRSLNPGQIRFGNDPDRYGRLHEDSARAIRQSAADHSIGTAPHSLRAVGQDQLAEFARHFTDGPLHMHLAEQLPEVEEVKSSWGLRPVEWALENMNLDQRWCLIHCTQMEPHETKKLAQTGATAGLCPITESSLGDGIFDGVNWLNHGGSLAIGSDSNIRISLAEEIRTLDYSQRLRDNARAALASPEASTGRRIFEEIVKGGAQASGRKTGRIEAGYWADLLALDKTHVDLEQKQGDSLLDSFFFAGDDRMITDVWSAGRHKVSNGQHKDRQAIVANYRKAMQKLEGVI